MRPAWHLSISSLSGRRGRTFLLVLAVALSSALVAAVGCALASVHEGMRARVSAMVGEADLRISKAGKEVFSAKLLDAASRWPETQQLTYRLRDSLVLENAAAKVRSGSVATGVLFDREWAFRKPELVGGRLPSASNEIVIDEQAAMVFKAKLGDTLVAREGQDEPSPRPERVPGEKEAGAGGGRLSKMVAKAGKLFRSRQGATPDQPPGAEHVLTIVGIAKQPALGAGINLRPEITIALETLTTIKHRGDLVSEADVLLKPGNIPQSVVQAHASEFPKGLQLSTSAKITSGLDRQIKSSQTGMIVASMLAYLCSAFIIMTGLTTSVNERLRELAMIRCIGGTRLQTGLSQLFMGGIIGVLGALIGVPLGMFGAFVLVWLFPEQLPGGFAVNPLGLAIATIGSILAGVIGATWPALRAARTTPLQALAVRARPASVRGIVQCGIAGLVLAAIHIFIITVPTNPDSTFWIYVIVGLPAMFAGYFLLSVPITAGLTMALSPIVRRVLRLPGGFLDRLVLAAPYRFGFTAGAMMLGLALLIAIWTNGRSVLEDWLTGLRFPDAFAAGMAITDSTRERIAALPYVSGTVAIQVLPMRTQAFGLKAFENSGTSFIAFEPEPFFEMTSLTWIQGSAKEALPQLKSGGAILVAKEFYQARGIGVGDTLTLTYEDKPISFKVVGVVTSPGLDIASQWFEIGEDYTQQAVNAVFGTRDDLKRLFGIESFRLLQIGLNKDIDGRKFTDEEALKAIRKAGGSGILDAGSGRQIIDEVRGFITSALQVSSLIAIGAMLVACLGVSNLIIAGIRARQFEFGVIRAVGGSKGLIVRLVLAEAIIISISACVLGTMLGAQAAKGGQRMTELLMGLSLKGWPPLGPAAIGWGTVIVITLGAALPAIIGLSRRKPRELLGAMKG